MTSESPQQEWKRKTFEYVRSVNAFVEKGLREGWENVGPEPKDPGRRHLADEALDAIKEANENGQFQKLREDWPPAHEPFLPILEANGQSIPLVHILPDKSIVARIGTSYQTGKVIRIQGNSVSDLHDIQYFGVGPNRRYFAFPSPDSIDVTEGWKGPIVATFPWPRGIENVPAGFEVRELDSPPDYSKLIPFPDASGVLVVSEDGIFVVSSEKTVRLLPTDDELKEHFEWLQKEYPDDDLVINLSMEHGAVSKNGEFIAIGCQDSRHLVFDKSLSMVGEIGYYSEYPHYAIFSSNDEVIAFNSCHFYNGATIGVSVDLLPGLKTESYESDQRITLLEDGARVYAGVGRRDEFIVGDAYGYVKAFSTKGEPRWQVYVGSSIGDIDISDDGKMMVVSTYAGYISIFELDTEQEPHQIGNSVHKETRRWIFWKNQSTPLIW